MRPPTAWSLPAGADDDPSQDELRLAVATPPVCSPRTCADQRRPGNQFTLAGYCVRTVPEVTKNFSPFASHSSSTERCGNESRETYPLATIYCR